MSTDTIGGGQINAQERYGSVIGEVPNGAGYDRPNPDKPRLPSLDLEEPVEPDFSSGWFEARTVDLSDHPLLRGLLMELPPKGCTPPPGWLDRWFEATRAILELLYVDELNRR